MPGVQAFKHKLASIITALTLPM